MRPAVFLAAALLLVLASCGPRVKPPDRLTAERSSFASLPGWSGDRQGEALGAFLHSCATLLKEKPATELGPAGLGGTAADWREACGRAQTVDSADHAAARRFFEANFTPYRLGNNGESAGLFTGYFEIELQGARAPDGAHATPLYRRPSDLVSVDLGLFRPSLHGERIAGRVAGGALLPYETRAEIEGGALARRGLELCWVADPIDAFFLAIQGSGRVRLADGGEIRIGYDGQNGHPYVPIGRVLADRGALARDEVSMQSIRGWLTAHPGEARKLMDENPSYVFFRELTGPGPVGAEGVVLTAGRSLAIDRSFLPLGVPLWLDGETGDLRRLVVAQDTGGAIRGPVRGDLFWGHGAEAGSAAGAMKARGAYYLLLPRRVAERRDAAG